MLQNLVNILLSSMVKNQCQFVIFSHFLQSIVNKSVSNFCHLSLKFDFKPFLSLIKLTNIFQDRIMQLTISWTCQFQKSRTRNNLFDQISRSCIDRVDNLVRLQKLIWRELHVGKFHVQDGVTLRFDAAVAPFYFGLFHAQGLCVSQTFCFCAALSEFYCQFMIFLCILIHIYFICRRIRRAVFH